jgi:hypothetical protein
MSAAPTRSTTTTTRTTPTPPPPADNPTSFIETSSRAVSPSCPSVVHRHSMGAPTPAAPHSHSGLRFRNRLRLSHKSGAAAQLPNATQNGPF